MISKDVLIDLFWQDHDVSKASTQLYSAIYQIRKLIDRLPFGQSIEKTDTGYVLRISGVKVDADEWEKSLKEAPPIHMATINRHMELLLAYENHYFMEHGYLWAEPEKTRCRGFGHAGHRFKPAPEDSGNHNRRNIAAFFVSLVISFFLNCYFTFKIKPKKCLKVK